MTQVRCAAVVNILPEPGETVQDVMEQLEAYIHAAGSELGNVLLSTVQIVPEDEVMGADDIAVASDPSVPDGDVNEVLMDPMDLIHEAERVEEARYV